MSNGSLTGGAVSIPVFMHISDIDGEYIPRKGDRVRYQTCPMPPRFDKPQVILLLLVFIRIILIIYQPMGPYLSKLT